jgi:hypothetical protein
MGKTSILSIGVKNVQEIDIPRHTYFPKYRPNPFYNKPKVYFIRIS